MYTLRINGYFPEQQLRFQVAWKIWIVDEPECNALRYKRYGYAFGGFVEGSNCFGGKFERSVLDFHTFFRKLRII
jgi:hypothetical protein